MKKVLLSVLFLGLTTTVWADNDDYRCQKHPRSERMSVNAIQKNLVNQGYEIHDFEYDNHCYQMEGRDPQGKKVEIYLDSKSGKIVHSEREWG